MRDFNFYEWLNCKGRKIVTRDGHPVRIVCWDVKQGSNDVCVIPIFALVDTGEERGEVGYYYGYEGRFLRQPFQTHGLDIMFADEEEKEELSNFEEADAVQYSQGYIKGRQDMLKQVILSLEEQQEKEK